MNVLQHDPEPKFAFVDHKASQPFKQNNIYEASPPRKFYSVQREQPVLLQKTIFEEEPDPVYRPPLKQRYPDGYHEEVKQYNVTRHAQFTSDEKP